jgi:hypothetical protein
MAFTVTMPASDSSMTPPYSWRSLSKNR